MHIDSEVNREIMRNREGFPLETWKSFLEQSSKDEDTITRTNLILEYSDISTPPPSREQLRESDLTPYNLLTYSGNIITGIGGPANSELTQDILNKALFMYKNGLKPTIFMLGHGTIKTPEYVIDQYGHSTFENCKAKGWHGHGVQHNGAGSPGASLAFERESQRSCGASEGNTNITREKTHNNIVWLRSKLRSCGITDPNIVPVEVLIKPGTSQLGYRLFRDSPLEAIDYRGNPCDFDPDTLMNGDEFMNIYLI